MTTNDDRKTVAAASSDSFHADALEDFVSGAAGAMPEELQALYEAIEPVAYHGTTRHRSNAARGTRSSPASRRTARESVTRHRAAGSGPRAESTSPEGVGRSTTGEPQRGSIPRRCGPRPRHGASECDRFKRSPPASPPLLTTSRGSWPPSRHRPTMSNRAHAGESALDGLLEEKGLFDTVVPSDDLRPVYYLGVGRRIEHLEITTYERLRRFATHLNVPGEVRDALEQNLDEEPATLQTLDSISDDEPVATLQEEQTATDHDWPLKRSSVRVDLSEVPGPSRL